MTDYHAVRIPADPRRAKLWRVLWDVYFRRRVSPEDCVLDLGAGYGDFVNAVRCRRRIAVDAWPGMLEHLEPGVEGIVSPVTDLGRIGAGEVDFALASNLVEHIPAADAPRFLAEVRRVLRPRGTLVLLQPNYRFAYREYFDDYTHVAVYSDRSLPDLLAVHGFRVLEVEPRFLPLTLKSRLPVSATLIRTYLRLPYRPLAKQMLVLARPS